MCFVGLPSVRSPIISTSLRKANGLVRALSAMAHRPS
jgi:hypothetical protein